MGERPLTRVLVADRLQGKTTALVDWVLAGKQIPGLPRWSRMLVVTNHNQRDHVLSHHRERADELLLQYGTSLHALTMTNMELREGRYLRGVGIRDIEFAFDDFEFFTGRDTVVTPALIAMTGNPVTVEELKQEARRG